MTTRCTTYKVEVQKSNSVPEANLAVLLKAADTLEERMEEEEKQQQREKEEEEEEEKKMPWAEEPLRCVKDDVRDSATIAAIL